MFKFIHKKPLSMFSLNIGLRNILFNLIKFKLFGLQAIPLHKIRVVIIGKLPFELKSRRRLIVSESVCSVLVFVFIFYYHFI